MKAIPPPLIQSKIRLNKKRSLVAAALFFFLIYCAPEVAVCQTVVIERDQAWDTTRRKFGKNEKNFIAATVGVGFFVDAPTDGAPVEFFNTSKFRGALSYKRKISGLLAFGTDLAFNLAWYRFKQEDGKRQPVSARLEKEFYIVPDLALQPFLRVNFDPKRGNNLGEYLDLGVGAHVPFLYRYIQRYDDSGSQQEVKASTLKIPYFKSTYFTAQARLGFRWIALYGSYRLTDVFREDELEKVFGDTFDLSRLQIGFQIKL